MAQKWLKNGTQTFTRSQGGAFMSLCLKADLDERKNGGDICDRKTPVEWSKTLLEKCDHYPFLEEDAKLAQEKSTADVVKKNKTSNANNSNDRNASNAGNASSNASNGNASNASDYVLIPPSYFSNPNIAPEA